MIYFLKDYYNLVSKKLIMLAINKSNERIIQPFYVLISFIDNIYKFYVWNQKPSRVNTKNVSV
jgi:hypothetical protein